MFNILTLFALTFTSNLLVTWNFRAVAQARYGATMASDAMVAVFGFYTVKLVAEATTYGELGAYVAGASFGSALGIYVTKRWFEQ